MQNKQEQHLPVQYAHSLDQQPITIQRMDLVTLEQWNAPMFI